MVKRPVFLSVLVVVVFTVGQFGETIYLPAGPAIRDSLASCDKEVQLIMPAFLLGYGLSQLFWGPLSDFIGRRAVILYGTFLFVLGSTAASLATCVTELLIANFISGCGIGCSGTMARTVLRDLYHGAKLQKAMSWVGMSLVIVPLISPFFGGYLVEYINFRAGFVFMAVSASFLLIFCLFCFEESNKYLKTNKFSLNKLLDSYKSVITNQIFWANILASFLNYATIMCYEIVMPFLIQDNFAISPSHFGIILTIPALGFLLGSLIAGRLSDVLSADNLTTIAFVIAAMACFAFLLPGLSSHMSIISLIAPMIIYMLASGLLFASTSTQALMPFTHNAGVAAAVLGAVHNVGVALLSSLVSQYVEVSNQLDLAKVFIVINFAMISLFYLLNKKPS